MAIFHLSEVQSRSLPNTVFYQPSRQVLEPILSKLLNSLSRFCHEHLVVKHPEYQKSSLVSTFVGNPMGGMAEGAHNEIISQCVHHCFQGKILMKMCGKVYPSGDSNHFQITC